MTQVAQDSDDPSFDVFVHQESHLPAPQRYRSGREAEQSAVGSLRLDEKPAFRENDPLLRPQGSVDLDERVEIVLERREIGDLPGCHSKYVRERTHVAKCFLCVETLGLYDGQARRLEPSNVLLEQGPEVTHSGKEPPKFPPVVPANLLG